jgi:chromosome segregation ATPase
MFIPSRLPSNADNDEIANHVNYYYPKLGPALQQLLERFKDLEREELESTIEELEIKLEEANGKHAALKEDMAELEDQLKERNIVYWCPHCGSDLKYK